MFSQIQTTFVKTVLTLNMLLNKPSSLQWFGVTYIFIQENPFENVVWKMAAILSRPQCIKTNIYDTTHTHTYHIAEFILWKRPANERRRYTVASSLIGWAHTQNAPCDIETIRMSFHQFYTTYFAKLNSNTDDVCPDKK